MTSQTTFTSCMHDQMLESNRDDVKLEAMRCVTVMTAKGKLSVPRTLFPHIVKNVSSKNPELKKLIYLYLTNFADQEPDLALLPVATLQKSLKSPNPLVRSSALKVLTSMRLNILSSILMATLRNSVNDLSPYVRKTVAHSIIKIYRLDPNLRPDLIEYIERLMNDKNSMVLSSVVATFEVVCPDRLDLVQKHYRRYCFILADCNEWGQTLLLSLLVRYVIRMCKMSRSKGFNTSPNDYDPKILLRSAKPLTHSNNSSVVMAVIKLFIAIANHNEVRSTIIKPLIRLLHSRREIQLVVLTMLENLTTLNESSKSRLEEVESDNESNHSSDASKYQSDLKKNSGNSDPVELNGEHSPAGIGEPVQLVTKDGYIPLDTEVDPPIVNNTELDIDPAAREIEADDQLASISLINDNEVKKDPEAIEEEEGEEESDEEDDSEDEDEEEDEEDEEEEDEDEQEDEDDDEEDVVDEAQVTKSLNNEKDVIDRKDFDLNSVDLSANQDPNAYREVFRPYIKSFYVKHNDCTQIRLVKLRILTNLSSSVNVSQVLKELQAYVSIYVDDKEFVTAAIQAIGRCAVIVKEVAHICLNGLTSLLSNNNEHIVSEAIVVLRSQIMNKKTSPEKSNEKIQTGDATKPGGDSQTDSSNESADDDEKMVSTVIKQVTKLLPSVTAPQARATILWILAEFCDKNLTAAKCAPNVLRSIAKSFCQEDNFVKLQGLNLVSKFLLSLDKEQKSELYHKIQLLAGYLFSLAKYDINHDVRDRGRFLKKLLEDEEVCSKVLNGGEYRPTRFAVPTA